MTSAAIRTNTHSKFDKFTIYLPNGKTLTGISHIPAPDPTSRSRPLLIGVHGGTCTSQYYDVSPEYTASAFSSSYSVPFVAIDRPGYEGSTPPSLDPSTTFWQATGKLLHESIFPLLWNNFGVSNGCTHLVTTSHSMGVAPTVVAAALYADYAKNGAKHTYPFAGCIFSGFGISRNIPRDWSKVEVGDVVSYPAELRAPMGLSEPELNLGDPAVEELYGKQAAGMPLDEFKELHTWSGYAEKYMERVEIPVLIAFGEHDWLWEASEEHLNELKGLFRRSKGAETVLIRGAPHGMVLSYKSGEWYRMCFEWAKKLEKPEG